MAGNIENARDVQLTIIDLAHQTDAALQRLHTSKHQVDSTITRIALEAATENVQTAWAQLTLAAGNLHAVGIGAPVTIKAVSA
ncbi:hypothetical protein ACFT5B_14235 [Luteimicrobium sp. NPDC057192]|uniref:hypothetical protein n=1 Tax=Luteimicrobium sp. NPDC057192 TaxID=3346042 RepID=UPI00362A4256